MSQAIAQKESEFLIKQISMERLGTPEDMGDPRRFLNEQIVYQ